MEVLIVTATISAVGALAARLHVLMRKFREQEFKTHAENHK